MMWDEETLSVMVSVKGMAGCEIHLRTASTDMHSGIYGASVRNAAQAMGQLAASFHEQSGRAAVEGFYNTVLDPTSEEREELDAVPFDSSDYSAMWVSPSRGASRDSIR